MSTRSRRQGAASAAAVPVSAAAASAAVVSNPLVVSAEDAALIVEIGKNSQHFDKIAAARFQLTAEKYQVWVPLFKAELEKYHLSDVITTDPSSQSSSTSYSKQQLMTAKQQAVYHMIVACVPQVVLTAVTSSLPVPQHTGFHAWSTLRRYFIGDEDQYRQSLETRFQSLAWESDESFPDFENKFQVLFNELEQASAAKSEFLKKSAVMKAIEHSNRKDQMQQPVFLRLETTHKLQLSAPFIDWLATIRTASQQIQTAVTEHSKQQRKRKAEGEAAKDEQGAHKEANTVTVTDNSPPQQYNSYTQRSGNNKRFRIGSGASEPRTHRPACRWFLSNQRCPYGSACKFSHDVSSKFGGRGQGGPPVSAASAAGGFPSSSHGGSNNGRQGDRSNSASQTCYEFAAVGSCHRKNCRFNHSRAAPQPAFRSGYKEEQQDAHMIDHEAAEFAFVLEEQANPVDPSSSKRPHRIIIDSGDSIHLTPKKELISNFRRLDVPIQVTGAFGLPITCHYGGEGRVPFAHHTLRLVQMVYCPQLNDTLLSMVRLQREGHRVRLGEESAQLFPKHGGFKVPLSYEGNVLTWGAKNNSQGHEANAMTRAARAKLDAANTPNTDVSMQDSESTPAPLSTARPVGVVHDASTIPANSVLSHHRYGHICGRKLDELIDLRAVDGLVQDRKYSCHKDLNRSCDACMISKMARLKFGRVMNHHVQAPNDMASADVQGPIMIQQQADGTAIKWYASIIVDVFSRRVEGKLIQHKSEASDHVISYFHRASISTRRQLKHFHADGGKEYNKAEKVLQSRGIKCTRTPVHTPQRNGIAERKNRTLIEMTRALLQHAKLEPTKYWQQAYTMAIHLHNRLTVVSEHGQTMHQLFTGERPNVSYLRTFGCDAFVKIADPAAQGKLMARAEKGIFVGYDPAREFAYRIQVGDRIVVSRDVQFQEDQFTVDRHSEGPASAPGTSTNKHMSSAFYSPSPPPNDNSESDSEQERSESDSEVSDSDRVDTRTLNKIAASEKRVAFEAAATAKSPSSSASQLPNRRSTRPRHAPRQTGLNPADFGRLVMTVESASSSLTASSNRTSSLQDLRVSDVPIPSTRRAALRTCHGAQWEAAMAAELASIREHNTFSLVPRPPDCNVVGCRWVFAVKAKDGWVIRFKARLVARGYSQQYGVDYDETYSPVLKYKTLRLLLALITIFDLELELMDVQTAYLNAPLKERVYMAQPEGFEQGGGAYVCLLHKAIYGLKQAGREWNIHLDSFVRSLGFTRCTSDTCVYIKRSRSGNILIFSVYVDDIPSAFAPCDRAEWEEIKVQLAAKFAIKFLGEADWLLNMRITRDRVKRILYLDQRVYTDNLLETLQMDDCRPVSHPGAQEELTRAGCPSDAGDIARMQLLPYRRAVGLLTYLANTSRPDIAHSVNLIAQFSQNPGAIHWRAVKQILRYLCGTAHYALVFHGCSNGSAGATSSPRSIPDVKSIFTGLSSFIPLVAFADANWGNCPDTRRSTTGYVIRIGPCWIDWNCHKQPTVALSSCEAEYMALTAATTAILWTCKLLKEMGFLQADPTIPMRSPTPPLLLCDNKSAIAIGKNDVHHNRTKHIDIRHHFIRQAISEGQLTIEWISTHEQIADILTKALPPMTFAKFRDQLVQPGQQESGLNSGQQGTKGAHK